MGAKVALGAAGFDIGGLFADPSGLDTNPPPIDAPERPRDRPPNNENSSSTRKTKTDITLGGAVEFKIQALAALDLLYGVPNTDSSFYLNGAVSMHILPLGLALGFAYENHKLLPNTVHDPINETIPTTLATLIDTKIGRFRLENSTRHTLTEPRPANTIAARHVLAPNHRDRLFQSRLHWEKFFEGETWHVGFGFASVRPRSPEVEQEIHHADQTEPMFITYAQGQARRLELGFGVKNQRGARILTLSTYDFRQKLTRKRIVLGRSVGIEKQLTTREGFTGISVNFNTNRFDLAFTRFRPHMEAHEQYDSEGGLELAGIFSPILANTSWALQWYYSKIRIGVFTTILDLDTEQRLFANRTVKPLTQQNGVDVLYRLGRHVELNGAVFAYQPYGRAFSDEYTIARLDRVPIGKPHTVFAFGARFATLDAPAIAR